MSTTPPENVEVNKRNAVLNTRVADSDLRPIRQAAEAAGLNMSTVVRECLLRYGQQTVVELVKDGELQAAGAYKGDTGKRRRRGSTRSKTISLVEMVAYKYEINTDLAKKWIALGRITVDGTVSGDPTLEVPVDAAGRIGKASV